MTTYSVDLISQGRPYPHYWEMCVGSCHAATVLRADVQQQLRRAHQECGFRCLRFHGLFGDPILSLLHIPEAIAPQAKLYFVLFILGYLPAAIAALFLTIANGISSSSGIFWINIVIVALNFAASVFLAAAFVKYRKKIFPEPAAQ